MRKHKLALKVFSNTLFQLIAKVITMSVTIFSTIIITRSFGREGYGWFSIMQTFPALFYIIADFGMNAIAVRRLSTHWRDASEYFSNILGMRLLLSLVLIVFASTALLFLPYAPVLKTGILLSLLLIVTQSFFATTNIIFQSKLRYDFSAIGNIVGSALILFLVIFTSWRGYGIIWVNFSYVIGGICTFLVNLVFVKKLDVLFIMKMNFRLWKELFVQSLPLGFMFVFSQINFKADSFLLSIIDPPKGMNMSRGEVVAIYGLPYKIFEVLLVVPTFFMNSMYPIFVRSAEKGAQILKKTFMSSLYFLFSIGFLGSILGIIFSPFVINVLGGSEFTQSIQVLRLLLFGILVFYLSQPFSWLILTLEKQKNLPFVYLISAVFNVGLNCILIPKYSFYASAVLTWSSELLILFLLMYLAKKAWREKYA